MGAKKKKKLENGGQTIAKNDRPICVGESCIFWSVNHLLVLLHNVESRKSVPMSFSSLFPINDVLFLCAGNRPPEPMTIDIVCGDTMLHSLFMGNKTVQCNQLPSMANSTYTPPQRTWVSWCVLACRSYNSVYVGSSTFSDCVSFWSLLRLNWQLCKKTMSNKTFYVLLTVRQSYSAASVIVVVCFFPYFFIIFVAFLL